MGDAQYKTAWVMLHKLREAMQDEVDGLQVGGEVEVDGSYYDGRIRPENLASERIDRRLTKRQTGTRRVVWRSALARVARSPSSPSRKLKASSW